MRFSDRIRAAYDGFTGKSETAENAAGQSETTAQHAVPYAPMVFPGLAEDIAFGDYDRRDLWAAEYNVRMVVDFVASKIAALPFHAYRVKPNGDREEAPNSEIGKLIADPSYVANETRYRLIHSLVVDMMLNDQWLMLLTMDEDYDYRLRRIPYGTYSVQYNALAEPMGVQITLPNGQVNYELPNKNVLLSLGYPGAVGNPKPMSGALGPLLTEARELASYRRFIAQNGGRIPAYVKRPAGMPWASENARNDFIQGMRAYRKGGGKNGGWRTAWRSSRSTLSSPSTWPTSMRATESASRCATHTTSRPRTSVSEPATSRAWRPTRTSFGMWSCRPMSSSSSSS